MKFILMPLMRCFVCVLACASTTSQGQTHAQPTPALAQTDSAEPKLWLVYSVGSLHTSQAAQFNQHNPGLGFEVPFKTELSSHTRWVGGRFKNSDRERSNYLGAQAMPLALNTEGSLRAGAMLGLIDGYTRVRKGGAFPLLAPMVRYEAQAAPLGLNLFIIPPVAGIPLTFALQIKVGFAN